MNNIQVTPVFLKNWNAVNKYRYIVNKGSSRSSKTHSIIQLFYLYALQNVNKKLAVFRDTKQICKQTVFEDMKKIYPGMPLFSKVQLNVTESIFKFPNGSAIHIEGTDDSIKIHGYHSDVLWFNESYNISKDTFDQLDMRCSGMVFLDHNPVQAHWADNLELSENAIPIHSTFRDNPFCPVEQRNKILSYQPVKSCEAVISKLLSEKEANEYSIIDNSLQLPEAMINELSRCRENEAKKSASEYNWQVYGLGLKAERPNRIYRWNEISLNDYLALDVPTYYGCDFGAVDPFAIVEAKYLDGCFYLRELNYESENNIRMRLTPTELQIVSSQDEGIVSWLFERLNIDKSCIIVCDNNRPTKIKALRVIGFDYSIAAQKLPGSIIDGIDLLNNLKVYYTSDSINLKYEQENYSRQVDRYGVVLEDPEDIDNHLLDSARYVALFLQQQGIIVKI